MLRPDGVGMLCAQSVSQMIDRAQQCWARALAILRLKQHGLSATISGISEAELSKNSENFFFSRTANRSTRPRASSGLDTSSVATNIGCRSQRPLPTRRADEPLTAYIENRRTKAT